MRNAIYSRGLVDNGVVKALVICDRQGLISREMFAIDSVKLLASAAKARGASRLSAGLQTSQCYDARLDPGLFGLGSCGS